MDQVREYITTCSVPITPESGAAGPGPGPGSGPGHGPSPGPSGLQAQVPVSCVSSRILSRNANGTIAMTSQPTNESELQLYRVLQRANLLSYYDTFICQGISNINGKRDFSSKPHTFAPCSKPHWFPASLLRIHLTLLALGLQA